ncbi:efflux RND transporter periplasmic adaptor subunit [Caproicibacter fermentans]|uniref:Efflux RND transporter periplasmic adaptor subunit n=1 Tax=Caproicibacter fermentans TaxID=2576756 RepID=A0A7G8T968_9FIRM|nr:efflux RND transporter periplasmic adaptor subunit [Caproicibacter fermentans]QNK40159.1 efflux RND transporter periplasmic adaptor subunit [Caproicibacter fermentans]
MKLKPKKFKFTKKTAAILLVAVLVLGVGAYSCSVRAKSKNIHTNITTTKLSKTNLQDTVAVSGTVHSNDSHNVYTTLTYPVKTVSVDVGDSVKKGDVLAVLDTATLEKDVEQQQYTTDDAGKSAALALAQAKRNYDNALYLNSNGLNNGVVTAQAALKTAADNYNYQKLLYENGQISKTAMEQAQSDYDKAQKSLTIAQNQADQDLKAAKEAYDSAVLKAGDKSADVGLEKLKKNLEDSVITAPADGTVTVKSATVGAVPTGVMFVIENTGDLIVDTQIKEMDAASVKPGDPVTIQTDATGDAKIKGTVTTIAPAATASTEGTGNVTYAAKVSIDDLNSSLRIGMKARMDIVLQEKKNVFVVPYDALLQKDDGNIIMAAEKTGALYKAKEIPVTTGLETDVSVEISGSGLKDGMLIIGNSDGISAGDTIQLAGEAQK